MTTPMTAEQARAELEARHRAFYATPEIDARLAAVIRAGPQTKLTEWDILHILRTSRSVYFDTHVQVVSGHHTATYLRFDSIARFSQLVTLIADDMAAWIRERFKRGAITGVLATASAAQQLADGIACRLGGIMPLGVVLTAYSCETGRIGTDVTMGAIGAGEGYLALNDVTTRGNCVSKLGKVITEGGGRLAGMMVFARRDSGQFPLLQELTGQFPFYYAADLQMPQWEPADCPLCRHNQPLLSWKDVPEL